MKKAILAWSGGKDSAYTLYKVLQEKEYEVVGLMTTINAQFQRISMHGIHEDVLEAQANSIGIPLIKMFVSEGTYDEYEKKMEEVLLKFKSEGVVHVIFGDIFLEDLRKYREDNLKKVDMEAVFPIWGMDTTEQLNNFLTAGFKTKICCVNDAYLGESFCGKDISRSLIEEMSNDVDPCGENGEFHTFCYAGPFFKKPLELELKEVVYKPLEIKVDSDCDMPKDRVTKGFWFADLILK